MTKYSRKREKKSQRSQGRKKGEILARWKHWNKKGDVCWEHPLDYVNYGGQVWNMCRLSSGVNLRKIFF